MLIVGGTNLRNAPLTGPEPATTSEIMSFGASLAATVVAWSTLTPDYGVYHNKDASR